MYTLTHHWTYRLRRLASAILWIVGASIVAGFAAVVVINAYLGLMGAVLSSYTGLVIPPLTAPQLWLLLALFVAAYLVVFTIVAWQPLRDRTPALRIELEEPAYVIDMTNKPHVRSISELRSAGVGFDELVAARQGGK